MAEAFAIAGSVVTVLNLIKYSAAVVERVYEFHRHKKDTPQAFRNLQIALPFISTTLEKVKSRAETGQVDPADIEKLETLLHSSEARIRELNAIFEKYLPTAESGKWDRFSKAIRSVNQDEKVHDIATELMQTVQIFSLHTAATQPTAEEISAIVTVDLEDSIDKRIQTIVQSLKENSSTVTNNNLSRHTHYNGQTHIYNNYFFNVTDSRLVEHIATTQTRIEGPRPMQMILNDAATHSESALLEETQPRLITNYSDNSSPFNLENAMNAFAPFGVNGNGEGLFQGSNLNRSSTLRFSEPVRIINGRPDSIIGEKELSYGEPSSNVRSSLYRQHNLTHGFVEPMESTASLVSGTATSSRASSIRSGQLPESLQTSDQTGQGLRQRPPHWMPESGRQPYLHDHSAPQPRPTFHDQPERAYTPQPESIYAPSPEHEYLSQPERVSTLQQDRLPTSQPLLPLGRTPSPQPQCFPEPQVPRDGYYELDSGGQLPNYSYPPPTHRTSLDSTPSSSTQPAHSTPSEPSLPSNTSYPASTTSSNLSRTSQLSPTPTIDPIDPLAHATSLLRHASTLTSSSPSSAKRIYLAAIAAYTSIPTPNPSLALRRLRSLIAAELGLSLVVTDAGKHVARAARYAEEALRACESEEDRLRLALDRGNIAARRARVREKEGEGREVVTDLIEEAWGLFQGAVEGLGRMGERAQGLSMDSCNAAAQALLGCARCATRLEGADRPGLGKVRGRREYAVDAEGWVERGLELDGPVEARERLLETRAACRDMLK